MTNFPHVKNKCFVFGSNLSGIHGAGAAKDALNQYGARWGVGIGRTGDSYAIPTKDRNIDTLPLEEIRVFVNAFLTYARNHPELTFFVTRIGCGLAGYKDSDIGPMFTDAPINCELPKEWDEYKIN